MSKGVFITATGTDVGKTYVTALIIKKLIKNGINAGYFKAALSGDDGISITDFDYVKKISGLKKATASYIYKAAVSPHLAAKLEGNPVEIEKVVSDYKEVCGEYDFVTAEGSGGIVCPIRYDSKCKIFLEDIVKALELDTVIVADAGLGTINAVVTTTEYIKSRNINIRGIILNNFRGGVMEEDNKRMIEEITGIPVVALVEPEAEEINIDLNRLMELYR